ncbi:MAG TPA: OsmC family protein [Anaeromyxobacteraceae bacterium]|nr:OsmC family protein [Anaeromyxobacteraceae bacterium]
MTVARDVLASVHAVCERKYAVETTMRTHRVTVDEPVARGGADTGPSPLEALASALAACTAITLRMYAERKGWELETVRVDCRAFAAGHEYRFERSIRIAAPLEEAQRARLAEIAEKTPVTTIVKAGARVTTSVS